jgi:hypothetical protein
VSTRTCSSWDPVATHSWDDVIAPEIESLRQAAQRQASATGAEFTVEVGCGAPVDELIALSGEVDLFGYRIAPLGARGAGAAREHRRGADAQGTLLDDRRSPSGRIGRRTLRA